MTPPALPEGWWWVGLPGWLVHARTADDRRCGVERRYGDRYFGLLARDAPPHEVYLAVFEYAAMKLREELKP